MTEIQWFWSLSRRNRNNAQELPLVNNWKPNQMFRIKLDQSGKRQRPDSMDSSFCRALPLEYHRHPKQQGRPEVSVLVAPLTLGAVWVWGS